MNKEVADDQRSIFVKNSRESIVVSKNEYMGNELIDIRTFFTNAEGELSPTKKGVTIRAEKFNDFLNTLSSFAQAVEEETEKE